MVLAVRQLEYHSFLDLLNADSVVVDLGMSDGAFAQEMVCRFGCRVFGVEPEPALFGTLPDMPRVVKEQAAIGPRNGAVRLHLNEAQCASTQFDFGVETSVEVTATTLTSFLDRHDLPVVDLVKMDIEGAEFDVLASVSDTDMMRIRQLAVEFHDFLDPRLLPRVKAVDRRLLRLGFRRFKFTLFTNGDMLYVHPDIHLSVTDRVSVLIFGKYVPGVRRWMRVLSRLVRDAHGRRDQTTSRGSDA